MFSSRKGCKTLNFLFVFIRFWPLARSCKDNCIILFYFLYDIYLPRLWRYFTRHARLPWPCSAAFHDSSDDLLALVSCLRGPAGVLVFQFLVSFLQRLYSSCVRVGRHVAGEGVTRCARLLFLLPATTISILEIRYSYHGVGNSTRQLFPPRVPRKILKLWERETDPNSAASPRKRCQIGISHLSSHCDGCVRNPRLVRMSHKILILNSSNLWRSHNMNQMENMRRSDMRLYHLLAYLCGITSTQGSHRRSAFHTNERNQWCLHFQQERSKYQKNYNLYILALSRILQLLWSYDESPTVDVHL